MFSLFDVILHSSTRQVWAWGQRLRGKLFAKGMEVKVFATDANGNIYNHATRILADVNSTHYEVKGQLLG